MEKFRTIELINRNGLRLAATNFGCKVISLHTPDRHGKLDDVVLGYDAPEQYLNGNPYFGALIGRFANRIANGKFTLNGTDYQLRINNRNNSLHGGPNGFHHLFWKIEEATEHQVTFSYISADGEEGFPGEVHVQVTYSLSNKNEFTIDYTATTDKITVINLTHHSFYNLAGAGNGDILGHKISIQADQFCAVDENLIPTGELRNVKGTPFDFIEGKLIGASITEPDEQLLLGNGYDHNWVLNKKSNELNLAAKVYEPVTGRLMEVFTTEPGLQFYAGNFLDGSDVGKEGKRYGFRSAFCLEAQHFPDSPNQPTFPSTILQPGKVYKQKTIYKFATS